MCCDCFNFCVPEAAGDGATGRDETETERELVREERLRVRGRD